MRQLALLLVLLVPGVALLSAADANDVDPARWEKDISQFEAWDRQNSPARESVLFVGSSSIRMWPTRVDFPDLPVINRGFGGAHISDVNAFAERIVLPYAPRIIVFYCGDNDIKAGKSIPRVVTSAPGSRCQGGRATVPGQQGSQTPGRATTPALPCPPRSICDSARRTG